MPCISAPSFSVPLPPGITLEPPGLPAIDASLNLCCAIAEISLDAIPLPPIPILLPPGAAVIIKTINATIDQVTAYLDSLPPPCPLD